ncbi:hypothetical protein C7A12_23825 [Pseudomonas fluorescens]|nr:hypothetical protein C7A12_23825 [Pseudomonas fluorescens]
MFTSETGFIFIDKNTLTACGEGACSRLTAQQSPALGGASHRSGSKLARHSKARVIRGRRAADNQLG